MSVLVDGLAPITRAVARRVLNTPQLALHLEARIVGWVMAWDHQRQLSVRSYIVRAAANEARKVRAMRPAERTDYFRRWERFYKIVKRLSDEPGQVPVNAEDLKWLQEVENELP